jgi:hypothetical protein
MSDSRQERLRKAYVGVSKAARRVMDSAAPRTFMFETVTVVDAEELERLRVRLAQLDGLQEGGLGMTQRKYTIGDVAVWRGEPPGGNPHSFGERVPPGQCSLMGDERAAALRSLMDPLARNVVFDEGGKTRVVPLSDYTFWHVPYSGPTARITSREQVDWFGMRKQS